jgi:hypothetical protein
MTGTNGRIYRWRVGEVEITRVLEFEAALFEPAAIYPEASSEMIARHRAWLNARLEEADLVGELTGRQAVQALRFGIERLGHEPRIRAASQIR